MCEDPSQQPPMFQTSKKPSGRVLIPQDALEERRVLRFKDLSCNYQHN